VRRSGGTSPAEGSAAAGVPKAQEARESGRVQPSLCHTPRMKLNEAVATGRCVYRQGTLGGEIWNVKFIWARNFS